MEINIYLRDLSYDERIKKFKNYEIRKFLLEDNNHYPFVWLMQGINDNSIIHLFDDDFIDMLLENDRAIDKLNAIMTCGNKYKNDVLRNDKLIGFIFHHCSLYTYISSLDCKFGQAVIDLCQNNLKDYITMIIYLKDSEQVKLINASNIEKFITLKLIDKKNFHLFSFSFIEKLIKYSYFFDIFMDFDINIINKLVVNGFVFPNFMLNNKNIILKYVSINNSNIYRQYINNLMKNNYSLAMSIEEKRFEFIRKRILSINADGIFNEYADIMNGNSYDFSNCYSVSNMLFNKDYDALKKNTFKNVFEMIIDYYFKDITYNFLVNLEIILKYVSDNNLDLIPSDRIELYNEILKFNDYNDDEKKEFINKFDNNIDYSSLFYDDYFACKMHSYNSLKNSLLKLDKNSSYYSKKLSKNDVDVFSLQGEPFFSLVHCTGFSRDSNNIIWLADCDTICFSAIGDENITVYRGYENYIFGFLNYDINRILFVGKTDSYSSHLYGTDKIQEILTPLDLLKNSIGYNEILYKELGSKLKPDFLVVFDEITDNDYKCARDFNIPILIIYSKYYKKKVGLEDIRENIYIKPENACFIESYGRKK